MFKKKKIGGAFFFAQKMAGCLFWRLCHSDVQKSCK